VTGPRTDAPAPADELAGRLTRTEVQRAASSIPGRGYILAGTVEMSVEGRPARTLHAGDGFLIPPRTPHDARDVGPGTGQMLSTYVVEIGEPLASLVR
jgi:Cupin domain